jgi:tetratricopeptide (TPR) repeat protein
MLKHPAGSRAPRRKLALAVAVGLTLVVLGGLLGRTPHHSAAQADAATPADLLEQRIARAQDRLRQVPGDWTTWANLGLAYLEHARISTDPTYYPKADEAVRRSLQIRPEANTDALVARGALANARHDFAAARTDALAAIATNAYRADAYAVLGDAETQLGHRVEATTAIQRLLDLRPGLSGYARASYDLEQRGQTAAATDLMRQALAAAVDRHDIAFCRNQLGDLALAAGDPTGAAAQYRAGLDADPASATLQRGQARVAAAQSRLDEALAGYAALTRRAPVPGYLLEYAELLRSAGHQREAEAVLQLATAAHQLFTGNGGVDGLTGAALAEATGRPADALREARSEWARRQHADVADALGWALHLSTRDSEALAYAHRAVDTGARSSTYLYHLGVIERALGDLTSAATHLQQALDINPSFSPLDAPAARAALAELKN